MKKFALVVFLPTMLGGCATASKLPDVLPLAVPTNAEHGLRKPQGSDVIGEYNQRGVTDPKSWRELNDSQAPKSGGHS